MLFDCLEMSMSGHAGSVEITCSAAGDATGIADIVRAVETAQARTAPVQRIADAVSGKFAYAVMGLSAATFAFWTGAGARLFPAVVSASYSGSPLLLSLQLACNVLVVACPCALGLATPTAVLVGTSAASRRGLLIRGGDVLEGLAKVDTVVFDKTGTLTEGAPAVAHIAAAGGPEKCELLRLAAGLEERSTHPLARAIVAERDRRSLRRTAVDDASVIQEAGLGIRGIVDGRAVAVGTREWLWAQGVPVGPGGGEEAGPGTTRVFVAVDGRACGHIDLRDQVRTDAAATVRALQDRGIRTILLSGDQPGAAHAVGAALGFAAEDVFPAVKPQGKLEMVEELQRAGARVAMVGDGINDTAALAAADVGIAMAGGVQVRPHSCSAGVFFAGFRFNCTNSMGSGGCNGERRHQ
jgi:Cu2+-exporting ATPase